MATTLEIPIFPLSTVLYPQGRLPLRIFEKRYVEMTKDCIGDDDVFGVCLIEAGGETGAPAVPVEIGCTARIKHWHAPAANLFSLITEGERVFRIRERFTTPSGLTRALVQMEEPLAPVPLPAERWALRDFLQEVIEKLGTENFASPVQLDDASWVAWRLAEIPPLRPRQKISLLEMRDPLAMVELVETFVKNR